MHKLSDQDFIRLLKNPADEHGFNVAAGELVSRFSRKLISFFKHHYLFTHDEARNFTDHVFAIFVENLLDKKEFTFPNKVYGYLRVIARNLAGSHLRKQVVANRYINLNNVLDVLTEEDPETLLITKDQVELVERKMQELANNNCPCVLRLWAMGYSFGEIAGILNYSSAETARATKHQCLKKLIALVKYS
ncbi:MAG TPA: hypothetical protein PKB07_11390 [Flavilitoribacter sp.]|nr:hypothetical protein [Flavilitoribacter sp.]